ncbi:DNA repair protein RecO [Kocuria salsicia]|uniref:DNA repair protein RecO n=1 Tax=Kocuria salsicia TaxID=664639 RepID=UPI00119F57CF|nr:DNA repair protein RecO [Kocuria salsicia]
MARSTFASRSYSDDAVVLRTYKLGEADRIVILLTSEHGQVRAVAKGVRRTTSRFGARLEPFNVARVQLVHGRTLDIVSQAVGMRSYGERIVADYERYTAAAAMAETAEKLTADDYDTAAQHFRLLTGAFSAVARGLHPPGRILDSYLLRAVSLAGWSPSFMDCARCGAPGPHRSFSAALGGAVCPQCRPPGAAAPSPSTFVLLDGLLRGDWPVVDAADPRTARAAAGLVAAYVQWHMERTVKALALVDRGEA